MGRKLCPTRKKPAERRLPHSGTEPGHHRVATLQGMGSWEPPIIPKSNNRREILPKGGGFKQIAVQLALNWWRKGLPPTQQGAIKASRTMRTADGIYWKPWVQYSLLKTEEERRTTQTSGHRTHVKVTVWEGSTEGLFRRCRSQDGASSAGKADGHPLEAGLWRRPPNLLGCANNAITSQCHARWSSTAQSLWGVETWP